MSFHLKEVEGLCPSLTIDKKGGILLFCNEDGNQLNYYDLNSNQLIHQFNSLNNISTLTFHNDKFYCSNNGSILSIFDKRNLSKELQQVIFEKPPISNSSLVEGEEEDVDFNEINSIDFNENGKGCVCNDNGTLYLFNENDFKIIKKVNLHTNIAMGVKFRPNHNNEVISVGLDQIYNHYSFKNNKLVTKCDLTKIFKQPQQSNQIVNPPFIYSLDVNRKDTKSVIGLGNGNILLFPLSGNNQNLKLYHLAHSYIINHLEFVGDNQFISCGLDGYIKLWNENSLTASWSCKKESKISCAKCYTKDSIVVAYENHIEQIKF
ncbi:hypothetical protein ABK040_000914 [Willaertia magna]